MNIWQSLIGMVEAELTGADYLGTMKRAGEMGITLYAVSVQDELTVSLLVSRRDYHRLEELCQKRGDDLQFTRILGLYWTLRQLLHRPVLVTGILVLLLTVQLLPTRVLFLQVEGNQQVETARILEAAEKNGLSFWTSRRGIRSEKIKNALLSEIPELQWVGVNTNGCGAVIAVREKAELPVPEDSDIVSIVAAVDGVVLSCTAQRGNLLCQPGQAVQKGEVLISGYTDCGLCIQLESAEGEIVAQTSRTLQTVAPTVFRTMGEVKKVDRNYSLILGKKRINFWNSSGIWDSSCGRIYKEYHLTLPGKLRLPLGIAWDEITVTAESEAECSQEELLRSFSEAYVLNHMAAGEIITQKEHFFQDNGLCRLSAQYSCREMIGRPRREQIGEYNGQAD